jgi:hypothetical protein
LSYVKSPPAAQRQAQQLVSDQPFGEQATQFIEGKALNRVLSARLQFSVH